MLDLTAVVVPEGGTLSGSNHQLEIFQSVFLNYR